MRNETHRGAQFWCTIPHNSLMEKQISARASASVSNPPMNNHPMH
jgi:hypothetical protein